MIDMFKNLLSLLWETLLVILDSLIVSARKGRVHPPENVLIVRLDAIGDFVLWLDSAKELRRLFPPSGYRLILIGNRLWSPLAETTGYFDEVWSIDRRKFVRNPPYRSRFLKQIARAGFDIAIQPAFSREFLLGDSVVRASHAKEKIGCLSDASNIRPWQKRISDAWYSRLIDTGGSTVMELERNAMFVRQLGATTYEPHVPTLLVNVDPPSELRGVDYYVLFPGAGRPIRQWPATRFVEIASRVHDSTGWTGVVCGGHEDAGLGEAMIKAARAPLQNWCGRTSLMELVAIIRSAKFVVTNETSAVHIAAAVTTPNVCIVGGGHYGRFMPYQIEKQATTPQSVTVTQGMECFGCNWKCIYKLNPNEPPPCIENITVAHVWYAIENLLLHRSVEASASEKASKNRV